MRARPIVVMLVAGTLVAACASTIDGTGRAGSGAPGSPSSPGATSPSGPTGSPITGFPSTPSSPALSTPAPSLTAITPIPGTSAPVPSSSTSGPAKDFACPDIVYPLAHLRFACVAPKMKAYTNDTVWPLIERKIVQAPPVNWSLDTGARHWGPMGADSLADIATNIRNQMVDLGSYGTGPKVQTTQSRAMTVSGKPAHLLRTTLTINPAWAKKNGVKVKHERQWILAVEVAPGDVSLWYVSVPDLVANLWPLIPDLIATVQVA